MIEEEKINNIEDDDEVATSDKSNDKFIIEDALSFYMKDEI